jgi:hypothetical protein
VLISWSVVIVFEGVACQTPVRVQFYCLRACCGSQSTSLYLYQNSSSYLPCIFGFYFWALYWKGFTVSRKFHLVRCTHALLFWVMLYKLNDLCLRKSIVRRCTA